MDDESEKHGCRYAWDWLWSLDVDDLPLVGFGLLVLFLAIVIWVRPLFSDYYVLGTWLDKFIFGCFSLFIFLAVLSGLLRRWNASTALVRIIQTLLSCLVLLVLLALAIFAAIAFYYGLRD